MRSSITLALAALCLATSAARAASFDCAKAASPFEKAVCADPALSQADARLAMAYKADKVALSAAGRVNLLRSQRSWLAFISRLCQPGQTPLNPGRWSTYGKTPDPPAVLVDHCLQDTYKDRQHLLERAVIHLGGWTFLATTSYRVKAALQDEAHRSDGPDAVHWIVTTLQIDRPATARDLAWNSAAATKMDDASQAPDPSGGGEGETFEQGSSDADISLDLVSASPDFIVTRLSTGVYQKGRAHGWYSSETQLWSLRLGRALTPQDVFVRQDIGTNVLADQVYKRFPTDWRTPQNKGALNDVVNHIANWSFLPGGLQVHFDPYSIAGYIPPGPVVVPWSDLKPYLRRDLAFDPAALQVPPG